MQIRKLTLAIFTLFLFAFTPTLIRAQQIILDNPIRTGELTCFQSIDKPNEYYYIVDQARLAKDENGKPKFSFLRFVRHKKSDNAGAYSLQKGDGGGIVHAVVELGVTKEQLRKAERILKTKVINARIIGPVIYKKGNFALISAFRNADGKYTVNLFGIGKAPILDGQKAAISMMLTSEGAEMLWETFNTSTPDISFSFEMELDGYHLPQKGYIEADFDKIYSHHGISAGAKAYWLGVEVGAAFDDLRKNGHIRVVERGSNQQIEKLVQTAYTKLCDMIFDTIPAEYINAAKPASLPDIQNKWEKSVGQAITIAENMTKYQDQKEARDAKYKDQKEDREAKYKDQKEARDAKYKDQKEDREAKYKDKKEDREAKSQDKKKASDAKSSSQTGPTETKTGDTKKQEQNAAKKPAGDTKKQEQNPTKKPVEGNDKAGQNDSPKNSNTDKGDTKNPSAKSVATQFFKDVVNTAKGLNPFGITVAYQYKSVKHHGKMVIDLNKYLTDTLFMRFDHNIGDLSQYMNDPKTFRRVVLDDPMNLRREIYVKLGKFDANDFDTFINFVEVKMRKRHRKGDITLDEVRIDRKLFNENGNNYLLMYPWKQDDQNKSEQFLEYEYQTTWNFAGDIDNQTPWIKTNISTIALEPPYVPREINIGVINEHLFEKARVRLIEVQLHTKLGEKSKNTLLTIPAYKGKFNEKVKLLMPREASEFEAEITLKRDDGKKLDTGRFTYPISNEGPAYLLIDPYFVTKAHPDQNG